MTSSDPARRGLASRRLLLQWLGAAAVCRLPGLGRAAPEGAPRRTRSSSRFLPAAPARRRCSRCTPRCARRSAPRSSSTTSPAPAATSPPCTSSSRSRTAARSCSAMPGRSPSITISRCRPCSTHSAISPDRAGGRISDRHLRGGEAPGGEPRRSARARAAQPAGRGLVRQRLDPASRGGDLQSRRRHPDGAYSVRRRRAAAAGVRARRDRRPAGDRLQHRQARAGRHLAGARRDGARAPRHPAGGADARRGGNADLEVAAWFGLLAPARTPEEIRAPDRRRDARRAGPAGGSRRARRHRRARQSVGAGAVRAFIAQEDARWGRIIRDSGVKPIGTSAPRSIGTPQ